jgi:hypothetical protein
MLCRFILGIAATLAVAGCDSAPRTVQCMSMGPTSSIVATSSLVTIDIYAAGTACDNNVVSAGAPAPLFSKSFTQGAAISLDVPPGTYTVVLSAFSDAAGNNQIGSGCRADTSFQPGQQVCIDLSVVLVDASVSICQDSQCPFDEYCGPSGQCVPGCKSNDECRQLAGAGDLGHGDGGVGNLICNMTTRQCAQCSTTADCPSGQICTAAGQCVLGCDCSKPPAPANCYIGTCSGPNGNTCSYALKSGAMACGTTCCNAVNSTCNANCTLTCTGGYADCDGNPSNGCEVNLGSAGQKLCGGACIGVNTCCDNTQCTMPPAPMECYGIGTCSGVGGSCSYSQNTGSAICGTTCCNSINGTCNGACQISCSPGHMDCNSNVSDGCEASVTDPNHCGGCTNVCNLPNATSQCPSGACLIATCNPSYLDCNAMNADGCECQSGPPNAGACCGGTSCETKHVNGDGSSNTGQNYFDCYPLGVPGTTSTKAAGGFDPTMAGNSPLQMGLNARSVFMYPSSVGGATADPTFTCGDPTVNTAANCADRWYVDSAGKHHCIRWCFLDDQTPLTFDVNGIVTNKKSQCYGIKVTYCGTAGHFYDSTKGGGPNGATCFCPWPTDPRWN